jgi:two-component system phosphate regulon sensor histidine kinase PhoR
MKNNSLNRIAVTLALIVLIPVSLFTISEVATVNRDEELIREIYKNQLESIIYSVNQYSQDYVSGWTLKMNEILFNSERSNDALRNELIDFMQKNSVVEKIFFADSLLQQNIVYQNIDNSFSAAVDRADIRATLFSNKAKINRLSNYERSGYNKIEPVEISDNIEEIAFIFITEFSDDDYQICGIVVNMASFVSDILAPKMQEISREDIIISCFNENTKDIIYTNLPVEIDKFQQEGALWLLPGYQLAISLKGRTIEGLVKQQSITNLILISLITFVLIIGVAFVYRNTRKEIKFAQTKSDFVSNVSHELRTPLALISMFAETLEMNRVKSDEKRKEYYRIISQETQRLSRIVNSILNFSKMEAGKRDYNFEQIELNKVVQDVLETYQFHLTNKGFKLNLNLIENELMINADKEAVSECLINIIDNAVKYSQEKKEIEISTSNKNDELTISVKDFGAGISEEDQKKIFEKFYRVSTGLVHNTKGTGMGLSIVRQVMEAHSGSIRVKSKVDKGSTFTLSFPIKNNQD